MLSRAYLLRELLCVLAMWNSMSCQTRGRAHSYVDIITALLSYSAPPRARRSLAQCDIACQIGVRAIECRIVLHIPCSTAILCPMSNNLDVEQGLDLIFNGFTTEGAAIAVGESHGYSAEQVESLAAALLAHPEGGDK